MTPTDLPNHLTTVYLAYAAASLALTIWLARTLSKNGEVFLEEVFADNPRLATLGQSPARRRLLPAEPRIRVA